VQITTQIKVRRRKWWRRGGSNPSPKSE